MGKFSKMKFAIKFLVVLFVLISGINQAKAEFITLRKGNSTTIGSEIGVNPSGVQISVQRASLRDVLQRIQNETGVSFKLDDSQLGTPVTASIQAANWKTAISELLDSFNVMASWGKTLDQSRIRIIGLEGNEVNVASASIPANQNPSPTRTVATTQSKSYTVSGNSMQPTLNSGDNIQVEQGYYANHPVQRGDLVALKFQSRNRPMVKRVVAVSGDSVEIKNGKFWINNQSPTETALKNRSISHSKLKVLKIQLKRYGNRIPNGQLIVMGDNTKNSFDSGDYGLVSKSQLSGRVKP